MDNSTIYIQFTEAASVHGGVQIRKWSYEPFEGGRRYVDTPARFERAESKENSDDV